MGVGESQEYRAVYILGECRLSARREGMRAMSFRLFYTEVIGQTDDHCRYTSR
jgi:hypothetical protein